MADAGSLEAALKSNPLVLVIGPGIVDEVGLKLAAQVDAQRTDVEVVLVQQADTTQLDGALAAGVRGSCPSPPMPKR